MHKELASRSSSTALGNTPTTSLRHLSTGALRRAGFDEVPTSTAGRRYGLVEAC